MSQLHDVAQYTHDRWHLRLSRQLNPKSSFILYPLCSLLFVVGWIIQRSTMCCATLKLVPWVRRTWGLSDGDTLIRDSQVFYYSVRLELVSFGGECSVGLKMNVVFLFLSHPLLYIFCLHVDCFLNVYNYEVTLCAYFLWHVFTFLSAFLKSAEIFLFQNASKVEVVFHST